MPGMRRKEEIVHPRYSGMRVECARDCKRVRAVALHSERQSLQPPQHERRGHRRQRRSGDEAEALAVYLVDQFCLSQECSADKVSMTVDIFGQRMQHDVRAML